MPSSSYFVHNYLRATQHVSVSFRHPKTTTELLTAPLQFRRRLHLNAKTNRLFIPTQMNGVTLSRTVVHHRSGFQFVLSCSAASPRVSPTVAFYRKSAATLPFFQQQSLPYSRDAYDEYASVDESDHDVHSIQKSQPQDYSTLDNIEDWKCKLNMLIRNEEEEEVSSIEKKDRRDFKQLSALATRMGLHSRQYEKVIVISKSPLPNYRSDLDLKRPQREVVLPFGLQSRVEAHLNSYLLRKSMNNETFQDNSSFNGRIGNSFSGNANYDEDEPVSRINLFKEGIRQRKNLELRNQQLEWQSRRSKEYRKSLPSYEEREALLNNVARNQVVVVSGETGCGKTTQLPQYILESEIESGRGATCSIICTQPRRISAISVAERVAAERGENIGESVGYQVRFEGMRGKDTQLLFCTTGILLRRLLVDRKLKGVTHIIIDEIHERGMNEDFLLIVLKDLLPRRPELRLILMSATLNADLFSSYFGGAPMIHIPGFTHPVQSHFLENILEKTGYMLTTHNQIDNYGQEKSWKMMKQLIKKRKTTIASAVEDALEVADYGQYNPRTRDSMSCWNPDSIGFNLIEHVLCHICERERAGAILVFMTGWDDINFLKDQLQFHPLLGDPTKVLLLACHGSMASAEQNLVFNKPREGIRKIILATNMAETGITINDVVFVVDCGKAKETSYDALNKSSCLLPTWISKASAHQRRGRAGRVQPGECYHLYPKCVYETFIDYQLPELVRTPLQSLCLQIKSLQLGSIFEILSRALQPPEPLSVQNAVEYLKIIGALDEYENLTILGRYLSMLPVDPKLGKMLIFGAIFNCLEPVMTVVAGLSIRDPFLMPFDKKNFAESAKAQFAGREFSDHLAIVRAYDGWIDAERRQTGYEYCRKNFLSSQTLRAIDSLRKQFYSLLIDTELVDPIENCNSWGHDHHLVRAVICSGLYPGICSVVNKEMSIQLKTMEDGSVLLNLNSVNSQESKIPYPWLVFNEKAKVNSVFLRDSTAASDSVVLLFGGTISRGGLDGHLKMLGGYLEFFMKPDLASTFTSLKKELEELVQKKLTNPKLVINDKNELLHAVRMLISEDRCEGRFVYGGQERKSLEREVNDVNMGKIIDQADDNKNQLQTVLARAGHALPTYNTSQLENNTFRASVSFNGLDFVGQPCTTKKLAEKDAAGVALQKMGAIKGSGLLTTFRKVKNNKFRKNNCLGDSWTWPWEK